MVNEEIVGGIISGMERGESIQKAMMSLFNAGYKKEEIEEAAAVVVNLGIKTKELPQQILPGLPKVEEKPKDNQVNQIKTNQIPASQVNPQTFNRPLATPAITPTQKEKIIPPTSPNLTSSSLTSSSTKRLPEKEKTVQKVSNYNKDSSSKEKITIFLLIALLVFLVGVLVAIFLFKDELINFFSTFFAS